MYFSTLYLDFHLSLTSSSLGCSWKGTVLSTFLPQCTHRTALTLCTHLNCSVLLSSHRRCRCTWVGVINHSPFWLAFLHSGPCIFWISCLQMNFWSSGHCGHIQKESMFSRSLLFLLLPPVLSTYHLSVLSPPPFFFATSVPLLLLIHLGCSHWEI